jgi:hypothetical protein
MPLGDLSSPQPPAPVHSHSHSPSRHLSAAHSTLGCLPYTPASPGLATKLHPSLRPLWPQKGIQLSKPVPTLMPRVSWKPLKSAPGQHTYPPSPSYAPCQVPLLLLTLPLSKDPPKGQTGCGQQSAHPRESLSSIMASTGALGGWPDSPAYR